MGHLQSVFSMSVTMATGQSNTHQHLRTPKGGKHLTIVPTFFPYDSYSLSKLLLQIMLVVYVLYFVDTGSKLLFQIVFGGICPVLF